MADVPLGVSLCNYGNVRITPEKFDGEVVPSRHAKFKTFENPIKGLRCVAKILITYYEKYDLDTVEKIIPRYAPRKENDTAQYIRVVAAKLNVRPDERIDLNNNGVLVGLLKGIVAMEVGYKDPTTRTPWADDYMCIEAVRQAREH